MNAWNPLGIPQVLIIITLLFFALWKQGWIRVILSIGLIIWGAFAMPYDVKIAVPLVSIGAMLFFMSVLNLTGRGIRDNG